jgi:hypothetical protein
MANVNEYDITIRALLNSVNQLPHEDREVAHDIWRRGGAEALSIWAEILNTIGDMTDNVPEKELGQTIHDLCERFMALMREDGIVGGAA